MPEHNCRNRVFLTANLVQKEKHYYRQRLSNGVLFFISQSGKKNSCFQPVVDGDVTVEVELSMTELDHRKSGSAEGLDFMHSWNALPQNDCNQL